MNLEGVGAYSRGGLIRGNTVRSPVGFKVSLLRLLIFSYGTVTVTVYGYGCDTVIYGYFLPF